MMKKIKEILKTILLAILVLGLFEFMFLNYFFMWIEF